MIDFDILWREVVARSQVFPVVQEYNELKHVYHLMEGASSYLEVGTAEGNSLYILSHALKDNSRIRIIDFGEKHTKEPRQKVIDKLTSLHKVYPTYGNSHDKEIIEEAQFDGFYDVVLIDAGHSYTDVIADAIAYGGLATKYIIFHDVCLPEVAEAFKWYVTQRPDCESYQFINSDTFGYGIMKVKA